MTDSDDTSTDADEETQTDAEPATGGSTHRVLGAIDDGDGVGVLGRNTASSDAPIGVRGAGPNASDGYGLYTEDETFVGGEVTAGSVATETVAVSDQVTVDFTGESGSDHGLEVIDRSSDNSEQIAIKADPDGSGELIFQDTDETNYKWGLRASANGTLYPDDHDILTTRLEIEKEGPLRLRGGSVEVRDGSTRLAGTDADGHALDATGGSVRSAGGVVHRQRPDPTTAELQEGEVMLFNSDGTGTGSAGDLVYAINEGGSIATSIVTKRSESS